ncbi:hypothetical protein EDB19DRAFT_1825911 [Suillus lakei]|nr:hypothetical protein EDB19DRAFT_1825911 [Suillus lakei]
MDPHIIVHSKSVFVDLQSQEAPGMVPVVHSTNLSANRCLTGKVVPGSQIIVTGIYPAFNSAQNANLMTDSSTCKHDCQNACATINVSLFVKLGMAVPPTSEAAISLSTYILAELKKILSDGESEREVIKVHGVYGHFELSRIWNALGNHLACKDTEYCRRLEQYDTFSQLAKTIAADIFIMDNFEMRPIAELSFNTNNVFQSGAQQQYSLYGMPCYADK